jgi:hypothetical protein
MLFLYFQPSPGTVVAGQMDRFFCAVGTDLPTEDPQIRYRLPLGNHEGSLKIRVRRPAERLP